MHAGIATCNFRVKNEIENHQAWYELVVKDMQ